MNWCAKAALAAGVAALLGFGSILAANEGATANKPVQAKPAKAEPTEVDKPTPAATSAVPQPRLPVTPTTRKSAKTGRAVVMITNDELERIYGPESSHPPLPSGATVAPAVGAGALETPVLGAGAAPPTSPDHAARVAEIQRELEQLRQKERWIKNPFLKPPQQTPEQWSNDKGKGSLELLQETQQRRTRLEAELEASRQPAPESTPDRSGQ